MPVNNVLNVPTYKFVISKYLLFWRARPCQPLVVDKEYFGSPPPLLSPARPVTPRQWGGSCLVKSGHWPPHSGRIKFFASSKYLPACWCFKCGQKTIKCNSWEQIHYSRAWWGQQHKKGQIWCQLKELLDLKSYLIAQNIKVVVCDRDIFVELVSDWAAGQELT